MIKGPVATSVPSFAVFIVLAFGSEESPEMRADREKQAAERDAERAQEVAEREAAEQAKWDALPETERKFCEALQSNAVLYRAAENDLKRSKFVSERGAALRKAVPGGKVVNWAGTVKTLTTTGQGNVVLELALPCDDFGVGTWNNELSDMMDNTLISRDSSAYDALAELKLGDTITFSGRLFSDERKGFEDTSMTESGTMTGGFFLLRF